MSSGILLFMLQPPVSFTCPSLISTDQQCMMHMLKSVQDYVIEQQITEAAAPHVFKVDDSCNRFHRLVVTGPQKLRELEQITAVAFFGEVRPNSDAAEAVHRVDDELIGDFGKFTGLLSYSTVELPSGNWANMALFVDPQARDEWARNERHTRAIKELAARHYRSIRLQNSTLVGPLATARIEIERTKYYSYNDQLVWRAVREGGSEL